VTAQTRKTTPTPQSMIFNAHVQIKSQSAVVSFFYTYLFNLPDRAAPSADQSFRASLDLRYISTSQLI